MAEGSVVVQTERFVCVTRGYPSVVLYTVFWE